MSVALPESNPDKSKVVLNSGSVMICPSQFGNTRSVYLLSEAIFDVTASDDATVTTVEADPELTVEKTADPTSGVEVDDEVE